MKYTFKNGSSFEGTFEQIVSVAKTFGEVIDYHKFGSVPRGYYPSDSKGMVKISEMHATHLRNALLKQSKAHFEGLGKEKSITNKQFLDKYVALTENETVNELFSELSKRK